MILTLLRKGCLLAAAITLVACNPQTSIIPAEQGVAQFHARLDDGKFGEIFTTSAPEMKKATTPKDLEALLEAVHRKMGKSGSATQQNWNVNYHTSGTIVTLTYKTQFAEGAADEQFVFRMENGGASLIRYNINSPVLVLK